MKDGGYGGDEYRELFELASEAIFVADLDGRYVAVNASACELLGTTKDALIGRRILDRLHRDQWARLAQAKERHLRGESGVADWLLRHDDGSWIPVEVNAAIMKDGRWVAFARDLRTRKQVEEHQRLLADAGALLDTVEVEWKELLGRLGPLALRLPAELFVCDAIDEESPHRVVRIAAEHVDPALAPACDALCELPLDRASPYAMAFEQVTSEDLDVLARSPAHRATLDTLGLRSLLVVPLVSRGALLGSYILGSSTRRFDTNDLRVALALADRVAVAVDNARLHRALLRAVQAREQVLAVVAHDLRSPLNSALLHADMLSHTFETGPVARTIDRLRGAVQRANRLVQDLVDVVRLDTQQTLAITRAELDADVLAEEAVDAASSLASAAGVRLLVECDHDLPPISADRERLLQMFDNVIGNALKFAPRGTTVTVAVRRAGDSVRFSVEDHGPGIAQEHLPHIFDRYWQAERSDRRGIGLGLYVVKGIVDAHCGKIWVESEPAHGTRLLLELGGPPRS